MAGSSPAKRCWETWLNSERLHWCAGISRAAVPDISARRGGTGRPAPACTSSRAPSSCPPSAPRRRWLSAWPTSSSFSTVTPSAPIARAMSAKLGFSRFTPTKRFVEVDLVLLLRAPLAVVEHDRGHRDVLAHAGQDLVEAHAPGAVADIGDRRAVRGRHLGADDRSGSA